MNDVLGQCLGERGQGFEQVVILLILIIDRCFVSIKLPDVA